MAKDYDRIFGNTSAAKVKIISGSKREATGKRSQPAYITIEGDKKLIDAYKKIAFNGKGKWTDVIKSLKESVNERMDKRQAGETLKQLGGNRFIAMTGAKNFVVGPKGMGFKIGRNAKNVNYVRIDLDRGKDLYDMYFNFVSVRGVKVKAKVKGVYADDLRGMFTKHTGMYTSL